MTDLDERVKAHLRGVRSRLRPAAPIRVAMPMGLETYQSGGPHPHASLTEEELLLLYPLPVKAST